MRDKAKTYVKMFDSGMTYDEISQEMGVSRSHVAGHVQEYRKKNGIAPDYRSKAKKDRDANIKPSNNFYRLDNENRKNRIKALSECKMREDGVIQCPPRYSGGFVNHGGHFDG